jgi:hypothetical protein
VADLQSQEVSRSFSEEKEKALAHRAERIRKIAALSIRKLLVPS